MKTIFRKLDISYIEILSETFVELLDLAKKNDLTEDDIKQLSILLTIIENIDKRSIKVLNEKIKNLSSK